VLPALVLAEGWNTLAHPAPARPPAAWRSVAGPVLVLPSGPIADDTAMLWSADGFPDLVNGSSGFTPRELTRLRRRTANFPDPASVSSLRRRGVRTVVVRLDALAGTPWAGLPHRPTAGLGVSERRSGDVLVFTIRR
jgi:hypothetical protein